MAVYVLHFNPPYRHAKHYIGYTKIGLRRIERHMAGNGSPLVRAAIQFGCEVKVAHYFRKGTRDLERKLKNRKDTPRWCCECCQKEEN